MFYLGIFGVRVFFLCDSVEQVLNLECKCHTRLKVAKVIYICSTVPTLSCNLEVM